MLVLRNEGRMRGMVGMEELRSLRKELGAIDVAEGPSQRQRREQGEYGGAKEAPHDEGVYAVGRGHLFQGAHPEIAAVAGALSGQGAVVDDAVSEEGPGIPHWGSHPREAVSNAE